MPDNRIPLSVVVFKGPTAIPNAPERMTTLEVNTVRGNGFVCPQPFFDLDLRCIIVAGRMFPIETVAYFERARMAKAEKPRPTFIPGDTIPMKAVQTDPRAFDKPKAKP